MLYLRILMLVIFFAATGVHLYASLKNDRKWRNRTKPFILLVLLGFYCLTASPIVLTAVLALIFSWLGDVLLMPHGTKWFTMGGIAFGLSHVFFIITYARETDFTALNIFPAVGLIVLFVIAALIVFKYLRPHLPKALFYPMLIYLVVNGLMNCFAWFRSYSIGGWAGVITAVGALLFFISDSSLFFVRFNKESRMKSHFLVMLTYSLGEFLIVLGLVLR